MTGYELFGLHHRFVEAQLQYSERKEECTAIGCQHGLNSMSMERKLSLKELQIDLSAFGRNFDIDTRVKRPRPNDKTNCTAEMHGDMDHIPSV